MVMNIINGFGARSYSIRGMHLPIVLLTQLSIMYKLKGSASYLKSGGHNTIPYISYSLSTVHHKLYLRKAFGVPCF